MATKWISSKHKGVRYRKHPTRKHGVKFDRYYAIRYQQTTIGPDGKKIRKRIEEGLGWSSEGMTEDEAVTTLAELKNAARTGHGYTRLSKKREAVAAEELKEDNEAKRQRVTVKDAWTEYLKARKKDWSDRHYADHLELAKAGGEQAKRRKKGVKIKPGPLSKLMMLKLSDLTPERVEAWAKDQVAERAARARLAFSILRAFVNWCNEKPKYKGIVSPEACGTRIKKETIPRMKTKDDCLQREQLPAWFQAVRGYHNPVISAYLQSLLLTGARREELARLEWSDLDFKWQAMTIHDKVEGERTIPLTPYVAVLLSPLPRRNKWVFSSPAARSGRLQEPRIPHKRALSAASTGIEGLTIHGLRRSFGTLSEWVEVPDGIVAQIMGHKPSATVEKHYRRRPLDLLRMWHEKIESWILEQAGIEIPKNDEKIIQIVK